MGEAVDIMRNKDRGRSPGYLFVTMSTAELIIGYTHSPDDSKKPSINTPPIYGWSQWCLAPLDGRQ